MKSSFSRRALLRTLAGASFAATSLRFLVSRADTGTYPLRFLFVYSGAGRDVGSIFSGTGSTYTLGPDHAALAEIRDKILIVDGLRIPDHVSEEHPDGRCSMLTGISAKTPLAQGISFDRLLANQYANGKSIYCGRGGPGGTIDVPISWHGANTSNDAFISGSEALAQTLFPGASTGPASPPPPSSAPPPPAPTMDDKGAVDNELALNDYLQAELARLRKAAPTSEFAKLDLHLQALQQLRADISPSSGMGPTTGAGGGSAGSTPLAMLTCGALDLSQATSEIDKISLLIAHGFACGQTSVAVVRISEEEPHHQYSHYAAAGDSDQQGLIQVDRDDTATFVKIIKYLSSFKEGDGTLLDNTVVVWSTEVSGHYGGGDVHGVTNMPFILAGGKGKLKAGQRLVADGRTNLDLYLAIGHLFGLDMTKFGDPQYNHGMLQDVLA